MDFLADYPRLEPAQQERFREVVTRLLSGHVLTPGPALKPDPDWRFAERYRDLAEQAASRWRGAPAGVAAGEE